MECLVQHGLWEGVVDDVYETHLFTSGDEFLGDPLPPSLRIVGENHNRDMRLGCGCGQGGHGGHGGLEGWENCETR